MALSPARLFHVESSECWCEPVLDHVSRTGVRLYIHREFDGDDAIPPGLLVESLRVVAGSIRPDLGGRDEMHIARLGCDRPGAARGSG